MKKERQYYEAYDDRYRQVHQKSLKWFSDSPSQIVEETLQKYKTDDRMKILEIDPLVLFQKEVGREIIVSQSPLPRTEL